MASGAQKYATRQALSCQDNNTRPDMSTIETVPAYQPAHDALQDRVVLVTGAGDGIGRAVSMALAKHGATVVLLGRTVKKLESVYDEIVAAGGPQPAIYPMDLEGAVWDDYVDLADRIDAEYGRLDGLLHNAGLLGDRAPIEHYDPVVWQRVLLVNATAPFLLSRACMPVLRKSKDASVVFTSSGVGRQGRAHWGAYAVSKFATEGLMETFADEMENVQNIRVNAINPGATRTGMRAKAYPGEDPKSLKTADDIANAYLWLLGPASQGRQGISFNAV